MTSATAGDRRWSDYAGLPTISSYRDGLAADELAAILGDSSLPDGTGIPVRAVCLYRRGCSRLRSTPDGNTTIVPFVGGHGCWPIVSSRCLISGMRFGAGGASPFPSFRAAVACQIEWRRSMRQRLQTGTDQPLTDCATRFMLPEPAPGHSPPGPPNGRTPGARRLGFPVRLKNTLRGIGLLVFLHVFGVPLLVRLRCGRAGRAGVY